jgi:hypothetical protein
MKNNCFISRFYFPVQIQKKQKTTFSKEALSETLLATDGSQVAFQDILKHEGKRWS